MAKTALKSRSRLLQYLKAESRFHTSDSFLLTLIFCECYTWLRLLPQCKSSNLTCNWITDSILATSCSFRRGAIFMKFHSMTSSYLSNRGTTSSQMITYNNNVFLPADTKSIVYKHTHSAQRWLIKIEHFTTALEAESPVSSEISDFTPYVHAHSNNLHIKYAEKIED